MAFGLWLYLAMSAAIDLGQVDEVKRWGQLVLVLTSVVSGSLALGHLHSCSSPLPTKNVSQLL